jgi:hypothetical protein
MCVKVLELAGSAARDNKKNKIIPRHVLLPAVRNDAELGKLPLLMAVSFPARRWRRRLPKSPSLHPGPPNLYRRLSFPLSIELLLFHLYVI